MSDPTTQTDVTQQGPPPGAILKPIVPQAQSASAPPPGAIIKPIASPQATPTPAPAVQPAPTQSITPQSNTAEVGSPAWREAEAPGGVRSIGDTINKVGQWMGRAAQVDPDAPLQPIQHLASGATKEAAKTVLGLSHMMGAHEDQQKSEQPSLSPGLETYGPWEGAGGWLETITEFMGGQKALEGLTIPERLAKISQVAKFLEKYPKIAAALGANARMGATAGGQTLVKTGGDTRAAAEAAALTAGSGLALEGAAGGVRNFLNNNAATRATVGGVETVVPGNVRKTMMKPEQQAGQEAIKRSAQDTLSQHLQEVNESRAIPPSPPALPARTGPFEFELQGPGTAEQTSGQGVVPAAEMPRRNITGLGAQEPVYKPESEAQRNVRELGSTAQATPARLMRDQPYMTSPAPGAEAETVGNPQGGGTLRTQDPNIVRQHIANLNDVIDHPEFEKLPPEQQQQILSARTDAQQQMGQYRDHMQTLSGLPPGMPNFAQINIPEAVKYTGNHIDVARNMLDVAVDGYDSIAQKLKLNDISGGKFNAIRNANKKAWAAYTDATDENLAEAESAVDETNKKMEDLLAKDIHGAVTPKELAGFNQIYGDGQKMLYIGKTIDRAFSGNPMGKEPWEMRGFNGQTMMNGLNALERKFGRPTLDRLLGKGQLDTLYQVARLNLTPAQMGKFGAVISPITKWLGENGVSMRGHVGPGLIAGLIGEATGVGFSKGALVGVSADYAARRVMNAIVTNPRIAEHVIYALDHGVNPKVYGPLIGSMIVQQESAKDQPEEQEQPHP